MREVAPRRLRLRVQRRDGQWRWVHDRAVATYEHDGRRWADGLLVDITAHTQLQQALADSERRYRLVTETMTDFVWTCDLEMRPTYVSSSVTSLTGYDSAEVLAHGFGLILSADSFVRATRMLTDALAAPLRNDQLQGRLELEHIHRDGSLVPTEVRVAFVLDEYGGRVGLAGITRDITERKTIARMRAELLGTSRPDTTGRIAVNVTPTAVDAVTSETAKRPAIPAVLAR